MSSTDVSAASSTGAAGEAQPLGAQPHLRHRLLARDIDRAMAGAGERGGGLDQQRRLADAGIAADQQRRAAHEAAADDAVELGHAGGRAAAPRALRRRAARARTAGPCAAGRPGPRGRAAAFSSAIVFHSPQASHLPCQRPIGRAAVLADEGLSLLGHAAIEGRAAAKSTGLDLPLLSRPFDRRRGSCCRPHAARRRRS